MDLAGIEREKKMMREGERESRKKKGTRMKFNSGSS